MTNSLTVVAKVFSNALILLLQKCELLLQCKIYPHFFSKKKKQNKKKIIAFVIFKDRSFNVALANNFVKF